MMMMAMDSSSGLSKPLSVSSVGKISPTTDIPHVHTSDEKLLHERYEFGDKLGEGSFGIVFVVTHRQSGKRYACKTINKEKAGGQRIRLITREVYILKSVSHEHIIKLEEVVETKDKMHLIMELCEGGELSEQLQTHGAFSELDSRVIMHRLTSVISYLHKTGTVHRDLKLENILLSSSRSDPSDKLYIKVTDFGLSILKSGSGMDKMMDDFCGTPMYMAPEITDYRTYSEKCDIWAMGVIMLKLLAGLKDDMVMEVVKGPDVKTGLSARHWNFISDEAKDCLSRMLHRDPAHRYTADEVLSHPWIQGRQLDDRSMPNVLDLMKSFKTNKSLHGDDDNDGGVEPSKEPVNGQHEPTPSASSSTGSKSVKSSSSSTNVRRVVTSSVPPASSSTQHRNGRPASDLRRVVTKSSSDGKTGNCASSSSDVMTSSSSSSSMRSTSKTLGSNGGTSSTAAAGTRRGSSSVLKSGATPALHSRQKSS